MRNADPAYVDQMVSGELIDLKPDGSWTPRALRRTQWLWWFRDADVSEQTRDLLGRRFGMSFEVRERSERALTLLA